MLRQLMMAGPMLLALTACATMDAGSAAASGAIATAAGAPRGTVTVAPLTSGLDVRVSASGMTPGTYGIHLHAVGRCEGPMFTSAGPHWNPSGRQHGRNNPQGAHHGDLPNLVIGADGRGTLRYTVPGALSGGGGLLDADGAALIIHARPDDELTDPTGNSGDRIACAVITAR